MTKTTLNNNRFENETMDNPLPSNVDMDKAARVRIVAEWSPPWIESELVTHTLNYIGFLHRLHASGVTLQDPTHHTMCRYLNYWLPLVAKYPSDQVLIPPADIAWLWHCHRLALHRYEAYCQTQFGRILECQAPFDFVVQETVHNNLARDFWWNTYPYEPFFASNSSVTDNTSWSVDEASRYPLESNELITATRRHRDFLWHIRQAIDPDKETDVVRDAVLQYKKFVAMSSSIQSPLVPTYPILLIWNTHMLIGIAQYNRACGILQRGASNQTVPDDLVYDRCATSKSHWSKSVHDTRRHWMAIYGEDYGVDQDMERRSPPADYYRCSWMPRRRARSRNLTNHHHHDKPCPGTTVHDSRDEQNVACSNDLENSVDMDNAARIRIMAGSSPPWLESDLVHNALKYIDFLQRLHTTGVTLQDLSDHALDRYLNYWLPLVDQKDRSNKPLIPPPDIAWLWHCHRLAPDRYQAYCHKRFGRILDCEAPFDFVESPKTVHTSEDVNSFSKDTCSGSLTIDDLVACTKRHRNFLWYIAKPVFRH